MGARNEIVQQMTWVALPFMLIAVIVPILGIFQHFSHYHKPSLQRYVVRIMFIVPVYATVSWLSLQFPRIEHYVSLLRDCYQGLVIATFFLLVVEYVGGEMAVIEGMANRAPEDASILCWKRDPINLADNPEHRYVQAKRFTLQFAVVMPVISVLTLIFDATDKLSDGEFRPRSAYMWISVVHMLSIIFAMYNMHQLMFFVKDELALIPTCRANAKFWCIKIVVFLSFLQSMVISLIYFFIPGSDDFGIMANELQDVMICIELAFVTVLHLSYFSFREFFVRNGGRLTVWAALNDAFFMTNVIKNAINSFKTMPTTEADKLNYDSQMQRQESALLLAETLTPYSPNTANSMVGASATNSSLRGSLNSGSFEVNS